ncbi:unnamed protein product [Rhodiola kirilowii]
MEFGDHHHRRDEDEEDDDDEEEEESEEMLMMNNNINTVPDNNNINSGANNNTSSGNNLNRVKMVEALSQVQIHPAAAPTTIQLSSKPRYRECLRNHAINVMGHALDGCGEFMPGGPEGTVEALKCAACGCHRNFHRKEEAGDATLLYSHHHQPPPHAAPFSSYYRTTTTPSGYLHLGPPPHHRPLALPSTSGAGGSMSKGEEDDVSNPNNGVGMMGNGNNKKRFRTRFTTDQKERMLAMAERIGWRIQKCDEDLVQQFCNETAVKRHVFKVWMHNNKHTLGKSMSSNNMNSSSSSKQQQLMN